MTSYGNKYNEIFIFIYENIITTTGGTTTRVTKVTVYNYDVMKFKLGSSDWV